jgi:hypothetical protein
MTYTIEVLPGNATCGEVHDACAAVVREVQQPGTSAHEFVAGCGVGADAQAQLTVRVDEVSRDFGATLLISIGGPVAVHVLKSLFDDFVRPRLRDDGKDVGDDVTDE